MDWFPWYPERYRLKTAHLTAEQDGIYRRLIDYYMESRQPLPNNDFALARIAGVIGSFEHASSIVRAFFYVGKDKLLHHKTCDEMLNEQDRLSNFRTERAKKAANARHSKPSKIKPSDATSNATSKPQALLKPATVTRTVTVTEVDKSTSLVVMPDWLPMAEWVAYKAKRGKTFTTDIQRRCIGQLKKWHEQGQDPAEIINQSLMNGWKGLFPLKGNKNGTHHNQKAITGHAANSALHEAASKRVEQERLQGKISYAPKELDFFREGGGQGTR